MEASSRDIAAAAATPALLICEQCDTVHSRRPLAKGEVAECARCGAVLERCRGMSTDATLALVLTALVVFAQATLWPIVTLGLNGQYVAATLWDMIRLMWFDHSQVVAVLAAATLFVFPLAKTLILGWLLLYARSGRRAPGFRTLMVGLHHLGPWTMSEVFVLGALVSIVKAHLYFDVIPDPGIYAYAALMLLITLFAGMDLTRLWDETREENVEAAP
ncbi:MAG: paraquat-inducible membrane protein A [Rhodanobacter sp. 68-29]|uniref:paraquat-inducible protein A n=1 Tax=Rhodanobacter sp. PCA2 TaxID=2006117 RepID=UPI00086EEF54|nr:paraquat-inducible protein A [Rhodanobacter sp. PCA2]MBA2077930.1 paraquat-inducible membrane protein A [Rhodanobacter sp. PCA2]MBN8922019.1 paraquat-inducible protein A [Rhodanobacter sp.]ODU74504.1 MAG: paraquat-inducible protein A [Rhodanobacter sp. SCN 69-32]OJY61033.1 MAG: paraquat-inducible membrane protein A [Rhodanobacter sp. 68-29]